jgi:hypothetical protein
VALPLVAATVVGRHEGADQNAGPGAFLESLDDKRLRWRQTLETCATSREGDRVLIEMAQEFPDPKMPERKEVNCWHAAMMARLAQTPRAARRRAEQPSESQHGQQQIPIDNPGAHPEAEAK